MDDCSHGVDKWVLQQAACLVRANGFSRVFLQPEAEGRVDQHWPLCPPTGCREQVCWICLFCILVLPAGEMLLKGRVWSLWKFGQMPSLPPVECFPVTLAQLLGLTLFLESLPGASEGGQQCDFPFAC